MRKNSTIHKQALAVAAVEVSASKKAKARAKEAYRQAKSAEQAKVAPSKRAAKRWRQQAAEYLREHGVVPAGQAWLRMSSMPNGFADDIDERAFIVELLELNKADGLLEQPQIRSLAARKGHLTRATKGGEHALPYDPEKDSVEPKERPGKHEAEEPEIMPTFMVEEDEAQSQARQEGYENENALIEAVMDERREAWISDLMEGTTLLRQQAEEAWAFLVERGRAV